MPLYEYECDACGHRFEHIQKFSDPRVEKCPVCAGPVRTSMAGSVEPPGTRSMSPAPPVSFASNWRVKPTNRTFVDRASK